MVISNLSYLEDISEDTNLEGGVSIALPSSSTVVNGPDINVGFNIANITQIQVGQGNFQSAAVAQANLIND
ncbi:MAG: hypothetical protein GVY04_21265 [Cyanobacteria bacterium]|jgi:hypothetical protein|nr:hypothetical protein [Cyanobacteria bacterium GSL.Bin1]